MLGSAQMAPSCDTHLSSCVLLGSPGLLHIRYDTAPSAGPGITHAFQPFEVLALSEHTRSMEPHTIGVVRRVRLTVLLDRGWRRGTDTVARLGPRSCSEKYGRAGCSGSRVARGRLDDSSL